jgi:hypothetical protein
MPQVIRYENLLLLNLPVSIEPTKNLDDYQFIDSINRVTVYKSPYCFIQLAARL